MPKRGEMCEAATFRIDEDEGGPPFWRGAGAGDKEESIFDPGEPLTLNPNHFPPGSVVTLEEPWDEAFYDRLYRHHGTVSQKFIVWANQAVEEWDGQDNADLLELLAAKFGIDLETLVGRGWDRVRERRADRRLIEEDNRRDRGDA